ncbi:MAG: hypothetical protein ACI90V_012453, partial [Bacillariaceae sp.]
MHTDLLHGAGFSCIFTCIFTCRMLTLHHTVCSLKVVYFSIFLRIEDASNCYVGEH